MTKDIDRRLTELMDELKADALRDTPLPRKKDARGSEEIESKLTNILSDLERKGQARSSRPGGPAGSEGGPEFLPEFGRYILVEKLGYDGIAETFKARRAEGRDGRFCVLKRIRLQFKKENVMAVFIEEARQLARLSHPNIVPLLDFGKLNEYGFLVLDHIQGMDLGAALSLLKARKIAIPSVAVAMIGIQVCRGLEAAYATPGPGGIPLGIIHGNITPSNILLAPQGEVLLTDFSLFRTAHRLYQAIPASFRNKIAYLSPQQARGEQVDSRTDIYSLGSVLYEMTAGQPVYPKVLDPAVFHKILLGQVIPVIPRSFEAPEALRRTILKALEYDPSNRQQKIEEFRKDLERYLSEAGESQFSTDDLGRLLTGWFGGQFQKSARAAVETTVPVGKTEVLKVAFPALEVLEDGRPAPRPVPQPTPRPPTRLTPPPTSLPELRYEEELPLDLEAPAETEPASASESEVEPAAEAAVEPAAAPIQAPLSQYRLLLVSPNGLTQKVVRMAFAHKDFDLAVITEGGKALAEIDSLHPDAVILDLNSAKVDAYDLCEKIKADPRQSQTCLVLIRKEFEKVDLDRLDTLNYDLMIYMPVQAREFEEKVRTILQQKRELPGG